MHLLFSLPIGDNYRRREKRMRMRRYLTCHTSFWLFCSPDWAKNVLFVDTFCLFYIIFIILVSFSFEKAVLIVICIDFEIGWLFSSVSLIFGK